MFFQLRYTEGEENTQCLRLILCFTYCMLHHLTVVK